MRRIVSIACLTALCLCGPLLEAGEESAQGHARRSSRAPWIGMAIGAGAGFGAGWMVGFGYYDQAINAEKKITTSVIIGTMAGAVCGYLIGRAVTRPDDQPAASPRNPFFEPASAEQSRDRASGEIVRELASKIQPECQLPRLSYGSIDSFPQEEPALPVMP